MGSSQLISVVVEEFGGPSCDGVALLTLGIYIYGVVDWCVMAVLAEA